MNPPPRYLVAPRYVLGEIAEDHTAVPGFAARAKQFALVDQPRLWGWGTVRRTTRDTAELAVAAGRDTLAGTGWDPDSIDAVIVCSTRFPGDAKTHGGFARTVLTGLGLRRAAYTGLTLNRCTNLLAAIDVAEAFAASGRHHRILVITTDRIVDQADRLESFALFSDGAAACAVTTATTGSAGDDRYEIIATGGAQVADDLDWASPLSSDLAREVNDALLKPLGLDPGELAGVLHPNLFLPVVTAKERQAGFRPDQLYTANVSRVGHCFAADPLINLVDRAAAGELRPDGYYLLAASVPGARLGVLVRAPGRPADTTRNGGEAHAADSRRA